MAQVNSKQPDPIKRITILTFILLLIASSAAGFVGGWYGSQGRSQLDDKSSQQIVLSESQLISQLARDVGPSAVSVNVISQTTRVGLFGLTPSREQSAGTGIVLSEDGVIVTNRHVVPAGATEVTITLSDGTELDNVEIIGRTGASDPLDVAFLKVKDTKGKKLQPAKIGDSSKVQVGDKIIAIGNALGQFQNSVTSGIISGFGRNLLAADESGGNSETLQNLFQTDAAINQGNSGGPLVNMQGEVIGINTAVAASGQAENIGFAIPIDDIKGLINNVLTKGKVERPYLGIRYVSLTDDYAYEFNLSVKRGAYIVPSANGQPSILPNSPASKTGLKEKDIITKIDNQAIDEKHSLTSLIGKRSVGDEVTLTVMREGKEEQMKVRLEAAPQT